MKTKAKVLILSLLFGVMTAMYSCSDDDDADPASSNDLCNVEICVGDSDEAKAFKAVCMNEYNDCVALGAKTEAECAALATETCTL